jgi:GT2 family glycosyltransferase
VISIVTVCLNPGSHLLECLDSVARQSWREYEHIVIDGGSTDGSAAALEQVGGLAYWHSKPDGGIADAMNQGLARARGEWLLFLHADDYLTGPGALGEVAGVLAASGADVVAFPIHYGQPGKLRVITPRGPGPWLLFKTGFLHQATFIRRAVFERIGGYRTEYRIAMDYEFFLRAWRRGIPMQTSDATIPTVMRDTGVSARRDWPSLQRRLAEERAVQLGLAPAWPLRWTYRVYWALYPAYKRLVSAAR